MKPGTIRSESTNPISPISRRFQTFEVDRPGGAFIVTATGHFPGIGMFLARSVSGNKSREPITLVSTYTRNAKLIVLSVSGAADTELPLARICDDALRRLASIVAQTEKADQ